MTEGSVCTPKVFGPAPWRKWLVVGLTAVFDVVFVGIALGIGVFWSHNIVALVVCVLLAAAATGGAARLVRAFDHRIELTAIELRELQGDHQVLAVPRSQLGKVRIWYHQTRFATQPTGMFVWDTDGRPVAFIELVLSPRQWDSLIAEVGLPSTPLYDPERRWLIRHPMEEGGTGGVGMRVGDRWAEPFIRPGWFPTRNPNESADGPR